MEYFTLEEDQKENQWSWSSFSLKKRILLTTLIILFALRAFGFLNVEWYRYFAEGNHQAFKEISYTYADDTKMTKNTSSNDQKVTEDGTNWALGLQPYSWTNTKCESEESCFEEAVKRQLGKNKETADFANNVSVVVEKLDVSGFYWLPLVKDGKMSYQVSLEKGQGLNKYSGTFSGEMNFIVYGVCSVGALKKNLSEKAAKIISDLIKNDFKK